MVAGGEEGGWAIAALLDSVGGGPCRWWLRRMLEECVTRLPDAMSGSEAARV